MSLRNVNYDLSTCRPQRTKLDFGTMKNTAVLAPLAPIKQAPDKVLAEH